MHMTLKGPCSSFEHNPLAVLCFAVFAPASAPASCFCSEESGGYLATTAGVCILCGWSMAEPTAVAAAVCGG